MRGAMIAMDGPTHHGIPPESLMVDIERPHHHDVLCGRGVTTNRHPGNESFRSLVSLNKELYVTSTKRRKMSISRSIVEAVRSLNPPGRFLEKNPVSGLWSDIGDRKAIEKTSQALRDGAAGLRKQLSADLGDPDFLNAVFEDDKAKPKEEPSSSGTKSKEKGKDKIKDNDKDKWKSDKDKTKLDKDKCNLDLVNSKLENEKSKSDKDKSKLDRDKSKTDKEKVKPVKAKPSKKALRRIKSNPTLSNSLPKPAIKKHKSIECPPSPSQRSSPVASVYSRLPLSPVSPSARPCSPATMGWPTAPARYTSHGHDRHHSGPYITPSSPPGVHISRSRAYHDSPSRGHRPYNIRSDHFTFRSHHSMQQRPMQWSHGPPPPRYSSCPSTYPRTASPSMVHPSNSPLPPGCHHFSPRGYVQKPPLSPRVGHSHSSWAPHTYPGPGNASHVYHSHEYVHPGAPPGPPGEWWSSPPDEPGCYSYNSLAVPVLSEIRSSNNAPPSAIALPRSPSPSASMFSRSCSPPYRPPPLPVPVPREFSPPISCSSRRVREPSRDVSPQAEFSGSFVAAIDKDEMIDDESVNMETKPKTKPKPKAKSKTKAKTIISRKGAETPDAVGAEGAESPTIVLENNAAGHCPKTAKRPVADEDEKKVEDSEVGKVGKGYSISPLPFDREDPVVSLLEVPEDILTMPISPCGPHD